VITTIHINIKIVGKPMLDKFLTGENVKVNGEIAGRRHILRTLDTPALRQTESRNLTGQKTLPTIWGTYMKLVTKYQIPINNCLEKCDEKCAYTNVC
jgi:hypothetical protein